jgi:hypothetical protein
MPTLHDTAYPRLKSTVTDKELQEVYTPTPDDVAFAERVTRLPATKVGLLVLLKTFQRLGYFLPFAQIPRQIVTHVSMCLGMSEIPSGIDTYDTPTIRYRHHPLIRTYLGVTPYGLAARRAAIAAAREAASTKEEIADIINVILEALVRHRYELPALDTLERMAFTIRRLVNRRYTQQIAAALGRTTRSQIDALFLRPLDLLHSPWERVKQEPKSPTVKHMQEFLSQLQWLRMLDIPAAVLREIPAAKVEQFAAEARTLTAYRMQHLRGSKRYALAAALLRHRVATALDELTEMFLRRLHTLHQHAEEALETYRRQQREQTDALIRLLAEVARVVIKQPDTSEDAWATLLGLFQPDPFIILERCEAHRTHTQQSHYAFLPRYYRSHRALFFQFLEQVTLKSSSPDRAVEEAIAFMYAHRTAKGPWLDDAVTLSVSWIPDAWWPLVTGRRRRAAKVPKVDKRYFELCLFSQIWLELKSGDLYVEGSAAFSDYRTQLISPDAYAQGVVEYGEQVGVPVDSKTFVATLREWLENLATTTDASFPANTAARLDDGKLILQKLEIPTIGFIGPGTSVPSRVLSPSYAIPARAIWPPPSVMVATWGRRNWRVRCLI